MKKICRLLVTRAGSAAALLAALSGVPGCMKAPDGRLGAQHPSSRQASGEALLEEARGFSARGDYLRAEQYLNAALGQGAAEKRVLPLIVRVCIADERYRDAAQHLEHYLRRHPSDHGARLLHATVQLSLGNTDVARKELLGVVAADPDLPEAHYALAVLFRDELGDYALADHHFRQYLRLRPEGPYAEEARGSVLVSLNLTKE